MANKNPREQLQERSLRAILTEAFFAWPSAVLIALFLILFLLNINLAILPFWKAWMWLVVGAVAEAAYLFATVTDPEANRRAVSKMLTEKFDPRSIRNNNAREQLQRALEYRNQIDRFVDQQSGALKVTLAATSSEISDWIGRIYNLAKHIDMFETNAIINRDRQNVPTEIANLKRRLSIETDPSVKAELQEALNIRQNLLKQLESVGNTAKRAELQMDNTIAQLGTVYAQMQLIDARDLDSGGAKRIKDSIRDEIAQLSDTLSAMDEVYGTANSEPSVSSAISNLADTSAADSSAGSQGSASAARRTGSTQR